MTDSPSGRRPRSRQAAAPNYGDRVPPHNLDAERGLIASIVIDGGDTLQRCLEQRVTADYFFDPKHQDIYAVAVQLNQASTGIDEITLTEQLRREGKLESAGGAIYINELTGLISSSSARNISYDSSSRPPSRRSRRPTRTRKASSAFLKRSSNPSFA
ncbi:MAG: hypothetical protein RJB43_1412 [Verrucomicrobiota bacterium]